MRKWTLARSLVNLRDEVNSRWPNRSKRSDGTIGDAAHSRTKSEHNPDKYGRVCAIDITSSGIDKRVLIDAAIRHPATWYVISDGYIYSRRNGFRAVKYSGSNPHTSHVHISIMSLNGYSEGEANRAANNSTPWGISRHNDGRPVLNYRNVIAARDYFRKGNYDTYDFRAVAEVQKALNSVTDHGLVVDGIFGQKTVNALYSFGYARGMRGHSGEPNARILGILGDVTGRFRV